MAAAGFVGLLPGIESWYGLGFKSKTGASQGRAKVEQVSDHVNMLLEHVPYVQTNFVLGLDEDSGPEPFELTKAFVDKVPGAFPAYSQRTAFGEATPENLELQRAGRVDPGQQAYGVIERRQGEDGTKNVNVAQKCTLCYDRLGDGQRPACAQACPTESIQFGDVDELRERASRRVEQLHELTNIDPWFLEQFKQISELRRIAGMQEFRELSTDFLRTLKRAGFGTLEAMDAQAGIDLTRERHPDLVLPVIVIGAIVVHHDEQRDAVMRRGPQRLDRVHRAAVSHHGDHGAAGQRKARPDGPRQSKANSSTGRAQEAARIAVRQHVDQRTGGRQRLLDDARIRVQRLHVLLEIPDRRAGA